MTPTPGYHYRLEIWFDINKAGKRIAHHWSPRQGRAFRMPLAEAELLIAQGHADEIEGHPMRMLKAQLGRAR